MTTTVQTLREPTGPRAGLIHLLRLRRNPIGHSAWLRENYGPVYRMRVFGVDMYTLTGPDAFERVFVNKDKAFSSGPAWSHFIGPFFNRGLMLLDFEEHLHHRRIMQHAFGAEELRRYHELMVPHIRRFLAGWGDVEKPRLQRMFKDLTLDLALEVFVGVELEAAERQRINKAFVAGGPGRHVDRPPRPAPRHRPVVQGAPGPPGPRGVLLRRAAGQAPRRRRRPLRPALRRRGRRRQPVQRRGRRQPHDLPADGRARHDHHDADVDGLPGRQAPRVAGALPARGLGDRRADVRHAAGDDRRRPGDEGVDAAVRAGALDPAVRHDARSTSTATGSPRARS